MSIIFDTTYQTASWTHAAMRKKWHACPRLRVNFTLSAVNSELIRNLIASLYAAANGIITTY